MKWFKKKDQPELIKELVPKGKYIYLFNQPAAFTIMPIVSGMSPKDLINCVEFLGEFINSKGATAMLLIYETNYSTLDVRDNINDFY